MNRTLRTLSLLLFVTLLLSSVQLKISHASDGTGSKTTHEIPMYTYHTHPPFFLDSGGLSYDLANLLSVRSKGRYKFIVKQMSRPRLNKIVAEGKAGIVPWVNPAWFKDKEEKKYMWSKGYLMEDGNAIISSSKRKLVYEGPASLKGLVFGGVRAHVYSGIDDYIKKTGNIKRADTENHIDNFRKLGKGRIDVTLMPLSGAKYHIKNEGLQKKLFISPKPHSTYKRRILIINKQAEMLAFINSVLTTIHSDPKWLKYRKQYQ